MCFLALQESMLFGTWCLKYKSMNPQNRAEEGESGLQLMLRPPVLILTQFQFCKRMAFPSVFGYLFDGF